MDNIIELCKKYMLMGDILSKENNMIQSNNFSKINDAKKVNNVKEIRKPLSDAITITKDQLFWCFFIILKGEHDYEIDNSFKREKDFKIECIEKLRGIKSELKAFKLRLNEIENELLNEKKITIKSLIALCLLYKKNIMYIWNRKYFEIINNVDESINIIRNENGEDKIADDISSIKVDYYRDNYWLIENIEKPLKAITAYTRDELLVITQKLDIKDLSAKRTKKEMYQKILEKL